MRCGILSFNSLPWQLDSLKNDRDLLAAQLSDAQSRAEHKAVVEAEP